MKLGDLFLPAWRRSDPAVRLRAVAQQALDEAVLVQLVADPEERRNIKLAALAKIKTPESIVDLACMPAAFDVCAEILDRFQSSEALSRIRLRASTDPTVPDGLVGAIDEALTRRFKLELGQAEKAGRLLEFLAGLDNEDEVRTTMARIKDVPGLARFLSDKVRAGSGLNRSLRSGLARRADAGAVFARFDMETLKRFAEVGGFDAFVDAALRGKGFSLETKQWTDEKICPECRGSGTLTVRTREPYTDRDWEDEERTCSHCEGGKQKTRHRSWAILPLPADPVPAPVPKKAPIVEALQKTRAEAEVPDLEALLKSLESLALWRGSSPNCRDAEYDEPLVLAVHIVDVLVRGNHLDDPASAATLKAFFAENSWLPTYLFEYFSRRAGPDEIPARAYIRLLEALEKRDKAIRDRAVAELGLEA